MRGRGKGHGPNRVIIKEKPKNSRKTLLHLWSYLKKRNFFLILAFVMVLLNIGASLAATNYLQPIIDQFLQPVTANLSFQQRMLGLARGVKVLGCIYLVSIVASYFQSKIMLLVSQKTIRDIRKDLFDHLQKLSIRYFDTNTNGELMSRFTNDVDTLNQAMQNSLTTFFSSTITLVGILGLMLYKSWILTLVALLMAPVLLYSTGKIMKYSSKYFKEQQKSMGDLNGYIEEIMTGQKVVKTFCYEATAQEKFNQRNEILQQVATTAQSYSGMMMPLSRTINSTNYAVVATVGGILTILGSMTIGSLVVFLQLVHSFGRPINEASNQYNAVVSAIAGAERIFEVMDEKSELIESDDEYGLSSEIGKNYVWKRKQERIPVKGEISFGEVTFGYNKEKIILKDISLCAKPGEKIAFVGSTGAGKTTIINLLTRFYDVNQGSITIDGISIYGIKKQDLRRAMAVVLQDTHLFTGTVRENIRYGRPNATDEEVYEASLMASAHSFIQRLPQGYDTVIEGDGANLSQGQRQLLNIARAAVADAPILILDEATSSVDTRTERHIEVGLDRLMENRTTFVIAHRLSTVRNADTIMVMEQGEIIERGTHESLLTFGGRYSQLYSGAVELD